ncbi:MAG: hypothetical protein LBT38_11010 [Deltaproteobacteria bacterium]|jgi:malate dehydrogenase (oxaloacetate-decarboxylating)|nr:hypothetical protein [Deltaproteobacteria bacterium]
MTDQNRLELAQLLLQEPQKALELTGKGQTVALISNGGQIPELGSLSPQAVLPYLEGEAYLIQKLTSLKVWPLAVNATMPEQIASLAIMLAPAAGLLCLTGLKDESFQAVERILTPLGLPTFFHPQQSLPILILAALNKALTLTNRAINVSRIVLAGFESDSLALVDFLLAAGAVNLVVCDRSGAIHKGRTGPTSWLKEQLAQKTNPQLIKGGLNKALSGADVYISRSTPMSVSKDIVNLMAPKPIVLNFSWALSPPGPLSASNQPLGLGFGPGPKTRLPINLLTALVLSGLFSGALKARATTITTPMKLAVAQTLADLTDPRCPDQLLPLPSRPDLVEKVASQVERASL